MTATFATLCDLDARLELSGHHPLTSFWRPTLERFYAHPAARTLVARVGRGGAKSHTSAKVALNETLFGDWSVPPGERHFWAFVSVNKEEAAQRLLLLESFLRALQVQFETKGDAIMLSDAPRGFRVFACQIAAVSGFRCYGYSIDEAAKYNVEGVNPAQEISGSLNAMCITHRGARKLMVSSPLGVLDYHAQRFDAGNTADQVTAHAPSWIANELGITEEETHLAEPDERIWRREYAALPQASLSSAFDPDAVAAAFRDVSLASYYEPIGVVDASSGGGDSFTHAVAAYAVQQPPDGMDPWAYTFEPRTIKGVVGGVPFTRLDHDDMVPTPLRDARGNHLPNPEYAASQTPILTISKVGSFDGRFAGSISGSDIVARIANGFRRAGVQTVIGDQRESFFLTAEFARHNLRFVPLSWTNAGKIEAVTRLKRAFAERTIVLPPEREKMKRELLNYSERITTSGGITYSARGTGHDDEAALLMTTAMAELERLLPGSPMFIHNYRHVASGR